MAYKFQLGKAKLSGSIETAQGITSQGGLLVNGLVDLDDGVISNAELEKSSVMFNGVTVALGATGSFGTDAVTEGSTNKYYTDTRARAAVSVTDAGGDGSLSYDSATGVVSYTGPSATEARAHFSAVDAGGDGSFSYAAGVFTYTGPSAAEARAHVGADGSGIEYSAATGVFSLELSGTALQKDASGLRTNIVVNTLSPFQNGAVLFNNANGQLDFKPVEEAWVRQRLSALNAIKYNSASGSISLQLSGTSLSQNADGLKADLKTKIGAYDNSGSLAYNSANGELTFSPVAPTWVKGHFSAGAGLDYDSATGAFSVGSAEVTNAMLAGAIENAKLVNSSVTVVAGGALTGGGTVALGSSITLDVSLDSAALEIVDDKVALKAQITGAREFTGDVVIGGTLIVNGTTTTVNSSQLTITDSLITVAKDQVGFAALQGLELGDYASLKTAAGVADVGNALSSSLPLVAPSMKAGTFYGNFVGASILGIVTVSTGTADISANVTRANAASQVLTLPSPAAVGQEHRIKCVVADGSNPVITIQPASGGKIEGVVNAQITLESFGAAVSLVYGGSDEGWMVF